MTGVATWKTSRSEPVAVTVVRVEERRFGILCRFCRGVGGFGRRRGGGFAARFGGFVGAQRGRQSERQREERGERGRNEAGASGIGTVLDGAGGAHGFPLRDGAGRVAGGPWRQFGGCPAALVRSRDRRRTSAAATQEVRASAGGRGTGDERRRDRTERQRRQRAPAVEVEAERRGAARDEARADDQQQGADQEGDRDFERQRQKLLRAQDRGGGRRETEVEQEDEEPEDEPGAAARDRQAAPAEVERHEAEQHGAEPARQHRRLGDRQVAQPLGEEPGVEERDDHAQEAQRTAQKARQRRRSGSPRANRSGVRSSGAGRHVHRRRARYHAVFGASAARAGGRNRIRFAGRARAGRPFSDGRDGFRSALGGARRGRGDAAPVAEEDEDEPEQLGDVEHLDQPEAGEGAADAGQDGARGDEDVAHVPVAQRRLARKRSADTIAPPARKATE